MTWLLTGLSFFGALMLVSLAVAGLVELLDHLTAARPNVVEVRVRDEVERTQEEMLEAAVEQRIAAILDGRPASPSTTLSLLSDDASDG
jgi:hypothetical protein